MRSKRIVSSKEGSRDFWSDGKSANSVSKVTLFLDGKERGQHGIVLDMGKSCSGQQSVDSLSNFDSENGKEGEVAKNAFPVDYLQRALLPDSQSPKTIRSFLL